MDQFIHASLSHTHHCYEVGMLKVSAYRRMGQPGEVVIPVRVQLNRKHHFFPVCPRSLLRIWSRGTRSAVPSSASHLILQTQAESVAYPRNSSRVMSRRSVCVLLLIEYILTRADVKNPARGHKIEKHHLEGKHVQAALYFPVCPRSRRRSWSCETHSAGLPASACSFSKLRLNLMLTHGIPPESRRRYVGVLLLMHGILT